MDPAELRRELEEMDITVDGLSGERKNDLRSKLVGLRSGCASLHAVRQALNEARERQLAEERQAEDQRELETSVSQAQREAKLYRGAAQSLAKVVMVTWLLEIPPSLGEASHTEGKRRRGCFPEMSQTLLQTKIGPGVSPTLVGFLMLGCFFWSSEALPSFTVLPLKGGRCFRGPTLAVFESLLFETRFCSLHR